MVVELVRARKEAYRNGYRQQQQIIIGGTALRLSSLSSRPSFQPFTPEAHAGPPVVAKEAERCVVVVVIGDNATAAAAVAVAENVDSEPGADADVVRPPSSAPF